jgi:predicted enzyme related to lactoylglutathione lyase
MARWCGAAPEGYAATGRSSPMEVVNSRTIIHPSDLERSLHFYGTLLDLPVAREFGDGPGRGVVFFAGGGLIEVVGRAAPSEPAGAGDGAVHRAPAVVLWLQVRDVHAAIAQLAEAGVAAIRPPTLEPWGLIEAWIDDPDGRRIHVVEVPAGHPLRRDLRGAVSPGGAQEGTQEREGRP